MSTPFCLQENFEINTKDTIAIGVILKGVN